MDLLDDGPEPFGYELLPTISEDEVAPSCRWDKIGAVPPFPVWLWVAALVDAVYYRLGTKEIERKWTKHVPTIKLTSNNRCIRSLMNLMQLRRFAKPEEADAFRAKVSKEQFIEVIVYHVDTIAEKNISKRLRSFSC